MAASSCHRLLGLALLLIATTSVNVNADPDPDPAAGVIQDLSNSGSSSSSSSSAAAAAAAAAGAGSGGSAPPSPPVVEPPPPVVPPIVPGFGKGFGFNKHVDFNAGLGSLLGLLPGFGLGGAGFGLPPPVADPSLGVGEVPPIDPIAGLGGLGGGYLGMPWFLGPQYIPATWWGSALAAKGDLLFPIAIFLFAVVGVIFVIKFLLALLVPILAKKWAIAEAFTHKARRSAGDEASVPQDVTKAHQAHVDELTHKVLPATEGSKHHQDRFAEHEHDDNDSDDDFDG